MFNLKLSPMAPLAEHGLEPHGYGDNPLEAKRMGAQSPRPFLAHSGPSASAGGQRGQFDVKHGGLRGMK